MKLLSSLKQLLNWYFSKAALPYWSILLVDSLFVIISGLLSFTVHNDVDTTIALIRPLMLVLGVCLICYFIFFRIFHTYFGILRYSSFNDLLRISMAVVGASIVLCVVLWIVNPGSLPIRITYADVIVLGLLTIAFMWTLRIWVKTVYELSHHQHGRIPVFILGVKTGGVAIAKNIRSSDDTPYKLVGFVSPDSNLEHKHLLDVKVYGFDKGLIKEMRDSNSHTLIVSPLMMDSLRDNEDLVNMLVEAGIKILVIPKAKEWDGKSNININGLHPVDVADLLPREKIEVDMRAAADLINNRVVMITGAAGSIGAEMVSQIANYNPSRLILIDQAETPMHDIRLMMKKEWPYLVTHTIVADIADRNIMQRIFSTYKPDYVFHAAAYKHVPMMEDNPYESVRNNILGTKVIADLSVKYGTSKFVMVSTDKAVNPTNVMGCSKRICEIYVQSLDKAIKEKKIAGKTGFVTTRFGNVLGSNGSVIPLFQKQIAAGGPLTVTHPDIIRFFMLIPEACKLVIEAGTMGQGGEIYVFDMGKPVKIAELAKRMIKLSGATGVEIKYTGLRDGEKLYEEVLTESEVTLPTFHPKIKIAKVREYDFREVSRQIDNLINNAADMTDMEIVAEMKAIVPEFKSQHSKYEALDSRPDAVKMRNHNGYHQN